MNLRTSSRLLLTFASVLAFSTVACSSEDNDAMAKPPAPDAPGASLDAGVAADSGVAPRPTSRDAGTNTGGGATGPCDPITGSGCSGTDEICALQIGEDRGECVVVAAPKAFEEACDQMAQDCGPGLICGAVAGEAGPTCKKVCNAMTAQGCSGQTGTAESYVCAYLLEGATQYAVCGGVDLCMPQMENACPANQTCTLVDSRGATGCLDAGTAGLNDVCGETNCTAGLICANIGGGAKCYDPCDPNAAAQCTAPGATCLGLGAIPWGLCVVNECDTTTACPAGETCDASNGATTCEPAGTVAPGGSCATNACVEGAFCGAIDNTGPRCFESCSMADPTCTTGECLLNADGSLGFCAER